MPYEAFFGFCKKEGVSPLRDLQKRRFLFMASQSSRQTRTLRNTRSPPHQGLLTSHQLTESLSMSSYLVKMFFILSYYRKVIEKMTFLLCLKHSTFFAHINATAEKNSVIFWLKQTHNTLFFYWMHMVSFIFDLWFDLMNFLTPFVLRSKWPRLVWLSFKADSLNH